MKLVPKKVNASQVWLLSAYSLCVITMFGMQHQVWRHIVFGIAATVLLLVVASFIHARMYGSCAYPLKADKCHTHLLTGHTAVRFGARAP